MGKQIDVNRLFPNELPPPAPVHPEEFNRMAAEVMRNRVAEIERRILAGENRIEIPAGGFVRHREVYTVPSWHRQPIKRLRVEWARWRARR